MAYRAAFDGLRGVSILLVLSYHVVIVFFTHAPPGRTAGFLGVDAFFVLSGFLITSLLLAEQLRGGRIDMVGFYGRRARRILPALVAFVVVYGVFAAGSGMPDAPVIVSLIRILTFTENTGFVGGATPMSPGTGHLWSLAIEGQFYLIWPVVIAYVLTLKRSLRAVVIAHVVSVLVVAGARGTAYLMDGDIVELYTGTPWRVDSLLVGALCAHLWMRRPWPVAVPRYATWLAAAGFAAAVVVFDFASPLLYMGGFTVIAALVGVIVYSVMESRGAVSRLLSWSPLRLIGRVSYGVYVWHLLIFLVFEGTQLPVIVKIVGALAVTGCVAAASWRLIERPVLGAKNRVASRAPMAA